MSDLPRTKGAMKAFMAFTPEWQQSKKDTFSWAGACQAVMQSPDLCEKASVKLGRQAYSRPSFRLTERGVQARAAIARAKGGE